MRRTYYLLAARIVPDWPLPHERSLRVQGDVLTGGLSAHRVDTTRWEEEPHVVLANLSYPSLASAEDLQWFTARYGSLGVAEAGLPEEPFGIKLHSFRWNQENLRRAWKHRDVKLFTDPDQLAESVGFAYLPVNCEVKPGVVELRVATCHVYIQLLLARDIANRRVKFCKAPGCTTPYFVPGRRDGIYCCHQCAVDVNLARFRKREKRRKRARQS